jgi:hypothetical protein
MNSSAHLYIKQYFPLNQKYFKEYLNGYRGFDSFLKKSGSFKVLRKVKVEHQNGDSNL